MKKVFIDCGYHLGEGMTQFIEGLGIDDTWEIHAFEPNPACDMSEKIHRHNLPVFYHNTAVWTENKKVIFNQEHQTTTGSPTDNSTNELDGWGSCLEEIGSSHITDNQIEVQAIDFADFLQQFKDDEVYCKMDIEGAEFAVLRRLIDTNMLRFIDHLWVEWHTHTLPTESEETYTLLVDTITDHTILHHWH